MAEILEVMVLIPIALLLLAVLGGVAINQVFNESASTTFTGNATVNETTFDWNTPTRTIWDLMPVIVLVGLILAFLGAVGLKVSDAI